MAKLCLDEKRMKIINLPSLSKYQDSNLIYLEFYILLSHFTDFLYK